jgi:hypothetical protein
VREALAAHLTAGADQQAMVRDVCQGGQGVALVVGRAGTGKTFALGIARHAWQLDGYRLLASAPTGIATISLQGEGFEDVATCDRLLGDLDRGRERLDARTVLVIDEAGMVVGAWPAELISQLMTRAAITITARGRATKARVVAPLRWPWCRPAGRACGAGTGGSARSAVASPGSPAGRSAALGAVADASWG